MQIGTQCYLVIINYAPISKYRREIKIKSFLAIGYNAFKYVLCVCCFTDPLHITLKILILANLFYAKIEYHPLYLINLKYCLAAALHLLNKCPLFHTVVTDVVRKLSISWGSFALNGCARIYPVTQN